MELTERLEFVSIFELSRPNQRRMYCKIKKLKISEQKINEQIRTV